MLPYTLLPALLLALSANARYLMYLTGQHPEVPSPELIEEITHVAIAFMPSHLFNEESPSSWPFFTNVNDVRSKFAKGTAIMVAIGGWGDTDSFSQAAQTEGRRKLFARNVKAMVDETGADGVDIDWEYPGGNGEDYKQTPNSAKAWEINAYPLLLSEIRSAMGPSATISAAVPGLPRDMIAFTKDTISQISASLDFFNIMTYDLMNRRDIITKHHTGIQLSLDSINAYLDIGVPAEKMNLGFAFYVKWFRTNPHGGCRKNPVGCKTVLMEDPDTGADLGNAGAFSWADEVPKELRKSFATALVNGTFDDEQGGHYYWDADENIWWSWDTPEVILEKFPLIVADKKLGGVFPWGLGEDSKDWKHLKALNTGVKKHSLGSSGLQRPPSPYFRDEL